MKSSAISSSASRLSGYEDLRLAKRASRLIDLKRRFKELFGGTPRIYRAPGRVNLIGEHTDYNDGFVMPVAIQLSTCIAIAPRSDDKLVVHSENFSQTVELGATEVAWSQYVLGVVHVLEQMGHRFGGANLLVYSDLPMGAGLSSSAALEVAAGYALLCTSDTEPNRLELARACQRAEHEFAGVRCGIMDQMIACRGRAQHALMLDTRSFEYELLRVPGNVSVAVCNTMVKHNLTASEYNTRRAQCRSRRPPAWAFFARRHAARSRESSRKHLPPRPACCDGEREGPGRRGCLERQQSR
jgi:galactokinase